MFSPIILQFICSVEDDIDLIVGDENCVLPNLDNYLRKHHYNFIIQSHFLLVQMILVDIKEVVIIKVLKMNVTLQGESQMLKKIILLLL